MSNHIWHSSCSASLQLRYWYVPLHKIVTSHLVTIFGTTALWRNRTALCMDFVPNFVSTTLMRSAGMNCRAHTFSSSFFALLFLAKSVYSESSCIFLWTACPQWNPQPQPQQAVINSRHHNLLYFCWNLFVIKYKLMTEVVVTLPWRRQLRTLENLNTGRVYFRQSINIIIFIFIFIQLYWHHSSYFPCVWVVITSQL